MTQPHIRPAPETEETAEAAELPALYSRLAEAANGAAVAHPRSPSGFEDPGRGQIAGEGRFLPVGAYPPFLNGDPAGGHARFEVLSDRKGLVWIRDGGGLNRWERRAQAGTRQSVTLVLNGRHELTLSYDFDGEQGWVFIETDLPEDLPARDVFCCEIERAGMLIFSGLVGGESEVRDADVVTPVRFVRPGILEGWARSDAFPGKEVFFECRIDDQAPQKIRTGGAWDDDSLRRFVCRTGIEPGTLGCIRLGSLAGQPAPRHPVWVFHNEFTGILIGNPRRTSDNRLLITLVGAPDPVHHPAVLFDPAARETDRHAVDIADVAPYLFRFRGPANTVSLPMVKVQSGVRFIMENAEGRPLGQMPSLAPLAEAAQKA